jgi:hypothetical protein
MRNLIAVIMLFVIAQPVLAQVMGSPSYRIELDSVNFGGGRSTSASFTQESTFGEVATGPSQSASFRLEAGYQQMDQSFITLKAVADVALSPAIDGSVGGVANGSTAVHVATNNAAGYTLSIRASSSPALVSGANSFADYTPAGSAPDFVFAVPAASAEFAFSAEGTDIVGRFRDNGALCGTGSGDTALACWDALQTVNAFIASSTSANFPGGATTTLRFRAESGTSNLQPAGLYTATTTVTAIAL